MKLKIKIAVVTGMISLSQMVWGDDIADSYNNGDTLTATHMNNIKSAVNSKQDRVTGACNPGEAIREIASDGTVTCETDDDAGGTVTSVTTGTGLTTVGTATDPVLRPADGAVSVSWLQLETRTSSCEVDYGIDYAEPSASGSGACFFAMPVTLPHGATLTSMACNAAVAATRIGLAFTLKRLDYRGTTGGDVFTTNGMSGLGMGTRETVVASSPFQFSGVVDNYNYVYTINTDFGAISVDPGEFRFYACVIGYTY